MDSKAYARSAWGRIKRNLGILLGERAVFAIVNFAAAAAVMECAEGTAKSHLHRATERLKRRLKSAYGELK